jgi:hypothetical protein
MANSREEIHKITRCSIDPLRVVARVAGTRANIGD